VKSIADITGWVAPWGSWPWRSNIKTLNPSNSGSVISMVVERVCRTFAVNHCKWLKSLVLTGASQKKSHTSMKCKELKKCTYSLSYFLSETGLNVLEASYLILREKDIVLYSWNLSFTESFIPIYAISCSSPLALYVSFKNIYSHFYIYIMEYPCFIYIFIYS
jgi:hypothetical protein